MFSRLRLLRFTNRLSKRAFSETIFDKIINKKIKADIVFEDDKVIVFKDINPVAKVHLLLIPKEKDNLNGIANSEPKNKDILGHLLITAAKVGSMLNLNEGYRLVINQGPFAGQTVNHLHIHLIGGEQLTWPPGTQSNLNSFFKNKT